MPVLQEQKRGIACIDDQSVIDKILSHLEKKGELPSMLIRCLKQERPPTSQRLQAAP